MLGQTLLRASVKEDTGRYIIDMTGYKPGSYRIKLIDERGDVNTYKVVKE